jgi:hypothetical protein
LLDVGRGLLPGDAQQALEEIEAAATQFDSDEFEQSLEQLEQMGDSVELETEFPSDFPLPEGVEVDAAFELDGWTNGLVSFSGTFDEAVAAFETTLAEAGYSVERTQDVSTPLGSLITIEFSGSEYQGNVTFTGNDDGMGIQVSLAP